MAIWNRLKIVLRFGEVVAVKRDASSEAAFVAVHQEKRTASCWRNRWRRAGVWDRLLEAVSSASDGDIQMIDSSNIRVHQHAANAQKR